MFKRIDANVYDDHSTYLSIVRSQNVLRVRRLVIVADHTQDYINLCPYRTLN